MATATIEREAPGAERFFVLYGVEYDAYVTINDALGDGHAVRLIYVDERLTFLTASRRHEWNSERVGELVRAVATGAGLDWESAGSSTYRKKAKEVGVEGDLTFYFGAHALLMSGPVNIDLSTQPPPDLAIEVELTHPADDALLVYGRLGVPEVWRMDVNSWTLSFLLLREDGTYAASERGLALPWLSADDVLDQLRLAEAMSAGRWFARLNEWVRTTILPRIAGG